MSTRIDEKSARDIRGANMGITEKTWAKLRRAVEFNDKAMLEELIGTIAATATRDEIARRSERRRPTYIDGRPYSCLDR